MTTKSPLCKHIIVPIDSNSISIFMRSLDKHISNMNCAFKDIKSNNFIDFIQSDYKGLIVISNKVTSHSNLLVIELYIKNQNSINANNVQSMWLPQSKLYLKILSISYFREDTNTSIDTSYMENIIKTTYIFDNVQIVSKPRMVKVSLRSDMAIVWIDIWDIQSSNLVKTLINCSFNVGSFIATIREANINLEVL